MTSFKRTELRYYFANGPIEVDLAEIGEIWTHFDGRGGVVMQNGDILHFDGVLDRSHPNFGPFHRLMDQWHRYTRESNTRQEVQEPQDDRR